jgi:hypothetical protein
MERQVMKTGLQLVLISMMMIFATPAWSGSAVAVYTCEQNETASEADVMAAANAWLEAAKGMKGGENLEVRVMFPMAVTMGESDFLFVVLAPTFGEWGTFMDGYEGSAAADADKKYADVADCPDSALWESMKAGSE